MNDLFNLEGKVALVTGGSRGIGYSICRLLSRYGAELIITGRDESAGQKVVAEMSESGRKNIFIQGDMGIKDDIERIVVQALREFEKIDVLVNNAGICRNTEAENMSWEEWSDVINVNLNGVFLMCQKVGRHMIERRSGSIINISSISAEVVNTPQPQCAYNVSKAGVSQLTRSLAIEWAKYNIRVNAIAPGYTETDMTRPGLQSEWGPVWQELTPMKRMAKPEEVASLAVYFASDASTYTTGSIFVVDGGYTSL